MKRFVFAIVLMMFGGVAVTAFAGQDSKAKEVRGAGCVQAGVETRCLVVKDVKSGKFYNVLIKEPRPKIGDGIEFTGVPHEGVTYCMQGIALDVSEWKRKDSLKCTEGGAPKP